MQVRTEIELAASVAEVWAVLVDFPRYGEWNPYITSITGELREGAKLRLELSDAGGAERRQSATLIAVRPQQELRWKERWMVRGLLDGEHFLLLSDLGNGKTRLTHGEDFSGMLLKAMVGVARSTTHSFVGMNMALGRRLNALRRSALEDAAADDDAEGSSSSRSRR